MRVGGDGTLDRPRLVTAVDCGAIVHPDGLANQVEGAIVMGLGGALFEAIDFDRRRGSATPRWPTTACRGSPTSRRSRSSCSTGPDQPSAGGGETPIIAVAPAIANAIFRASGVRLRSMPLAPQGMISRV